VHLFCFAGEAVGVAASGGNCPVGSCAMLAREGEKES
jgi:hypothetical protein